MCSKPIFCYKNCSRLLEQQRITANAKRCLKVAEHNRDRPNDTCVLMINTIVYDLSLRESPFNNDTGGMKIQNHLPWTPSVFHQIFNCLLHRLPKV